MNRIQTALLSRLSVAVYLVVGLSAVVLALLAAFQLEEGVWQDFLLNLSAGLIGVVLIFLVVDRLFKLRLDEVRNEQVLHSVNTLCRKVETLEKELQVGTLTILPSRAELYGTARANLRLDQWETVCIFAPVGLWRKDKEKKKWLVELQEHVSKERVNAVWGVFGLPPRNIGLEPRLTETVSEDLRYFYWRLRIFNECVKVGLRYLPPSVVSTGFGVLVFEHRDRKTGQVGFALASRSHEDVIDCGCCSGHPDLYTLTMGWFSQQIWGKSAARFVLQDDKVSFKEKWPEVVRLWYPDIKVSDWDATEDPADLE